MNRRDALILGAIGAAALGAGALVGALGVQSTSGAAALLSASFRDLEGRVRRLSEWQGRATLFNFWASWCAPCRDEMPLLDKAIWKYPIHVVGIGIDSDSNVREFAAKSGVRYQILVAGTEAIALMKALGNPSGGLPFTVALDRAGRIAGRKLGAFSVPELEGMAASLVG